MNNMSERIPGRQGSRCLKVFKSASGLAKGPSVDMTRDYGTEKCARTSFAMEAWNRSERSQPLVSRRSVIMISDKRLEAKSRVKGDIVEGDAAIEDRRRGSGIRWLSSMPRYPYKSASARVSACLADEEDKSDMPAPA